MRLTRHAQRRMRQRGFPELSPEILRMWGRLEKAPGGALRCSLGKKEANRLMNELTYEYQMARKMIDKCTDGTLILEDDIALTLYRRG